MPQVIGHCKRDDTGCSFGRGQQVGGQSDQGGIDQAHAGAEQESPQQKLGVGSGLGVNNTDINSNAVRPIWSTPAIREKPGGADDRGGRGKNCKKYSGEDKNAGAPSRAGRLELPPRGARKKLPLTEVRLSGKRGRATSADSLRSISGSLKIRDRTGDTREAAMVRPKNRRQPGP